MYMKLFGKFREKDKSEVKSAVFEQFHISEIEFEGLYEKAIK